MRVLSLIHEDDARAGVFADAVTALGHELEEASLALGRPPRDEPHTYDATMVFGGAMNVDEHAAHPWLAEERALLADLLARERPLLGVCLGSQLLAEAAGAEVGPLAGGPEIGWHEVELLPAARGDAVLGSLPERFRAFQWHGYGIAGEPPGVELGRGGGGVQAYRVDGAPAWGIQFHAEVDAPTVAGWLANYSDDADARAAVIDPRRLAEQTAGEIARWNELGRRLCRGFIAAARR